MKVSECTEFNCCWYSESDKKCFLSGQYIRHESQCLRYAIQKKRLGDKVNEN